MSDKEEEKKDIFDGHHFWHYYKFYDHTQMYHWNHYEPFYDDGSDYNTNAKSYYDFLARFVKWCAWVEYIINRLFDRNIATEDTPSVNLQKIGDWIDNGKCGEKNYDDIITLKADVNISKLIKTLTYEHIDPTTYQIGNGTVIETDGLWTPDFSPVLTGIDKKIGVIDQEIVIINQEIEKINQEIEKINQEIDEINKEIKAIQDDIVTIKQEIAQIQADIKIMKDNIAHNTTAIQTLLNNLFASGAINKASWDFAFNTNRNLVTGNINIFGGTTDGGNFLRSNNGQSEKDITAAINVTKK